MLPAVPGPPPVPRASARRAARLRAPLEAVRTRYQHGFLDTDPLALVVSLRSRLDREVGGFLAAFWRRALPMVG